MDPGLFHCPASSTPTTHRGRQPRCRDPPDCTPETVNALSKFAARRRPQLDGNATRQHADVAQQAERDHAMVEATSSKLVIRSTIHLGCVLALRTARHGVGGRDVRGLSSGHVQRDTSSDGMLALGHSRSEFRSMSRSSRGPGLRVFSPATRVRLPHAMPVQQKPSSSSRFDGGNRPQRLGGSGTRDRKPFFHFQLLR